MKILFALVLIAFSSCKLSSSKNDGSAVNDSLNIAVPKPGKLSEKEIINYHDRLQSFFDSALLRRGFNGSILIAKEGNILLEKYVGYRDLRLKDSLTDTTSFHLASTSKPFTAMAILRMVQDNKLLLTDTVTKFFPELPYKGITVQMLLTHRSGLPNYVNFLGDAKKWDTRIMVTNEKMMDYLITKKPAREFAPNARFTYSNTNYVLLAMIIEKLSGQPFPAYMQENIFGPLEMNHTFVFTLDNDSTATRSFLPNGRVWDNDHLEGTYGDKNVYSTPRDMLKWDQALYSEDFLRKTLLDSAFSPYSFERPGIHNYGLGWRMLLMPNGKKVIYHFGRWHGFTPAFARLLDEKVVIIILGNKFNRNIYNAAHESYDLFGDYQQKHSENEDAEAKTMQVNEKPVRKSQVKVAPKVSIKKTVRKKGK